MARRNNTGSIKPCLECGRPLRPNTWSAKDYPGTLVHAGNSLCSACRTSKRRAEVRAQQSRGPGESVEANKRNLEAFLKRISNDRQRLEQRRKVRMVIR